jgi:PAS domain-containing protein
LTTNEENGSEQAIAKRKKVDEVITQSEEKYRQLFNAMTDMFAAVDIIYFDIKLK